jgi:T4-like virus tail tube protein gp19
MAVLREHPYGRFNFLVDLGTGNAEGPDAGFQECSQIGMEIGVAEYRNGNDRENAPRKLPGLARVADVTLKRA